MNVLQNILNDENMVCESLENFLKHFFAASTLPYQTVRDVGDLVLCYNKTVLEQPKEVHKCLLSWNEFQEFIVFHFLQQDPHQHNNDSELKLHPVSSSIQSLFNNSAWEHLYEFVGTEIMKIMLTKCYINIGVGNNSYVCLYTKEIRQIFRKCDENNKAVTSNNKKIYNSGATVTANRKPPNSGYKGSVSLNLKNSMYRAGIFPNWPVSHILSKSNLESIVVSNILDDILQEDVGVYILPKNIQVIKDKLNSLKSLLSYLVRKHKRLAPYSVALKNVLCGKVQNSVIQVTGETKNLVSVPCKEIFSTSEQLLYNGTVNTDNTADVNSEKKRKLDVYVTGSGREPSACSSLSEKSSEQVTKRMKLDNLLDVRQCSDVSEMNIISDHVQRKKACSKRQSITACEKYMLICEKRKKKFLKLKPINASILVKFLNKVLRQILHRKLFAIEKNWAAFFYFIKKTVTLGKECSLLLKDVLNKINSKCINWLTEVPAQFRESVLAKFLKWVWNRIIVCIIAANFYVTEFSHCKNKIVFYEKRVWKSLEDTVFSHLLNDRKIVPISRRQWEEYCKLKNSGKFRILPKGDGARPILIATKTMKEDYMLLVSKVFLQQLNTHFRTSIHPLNIKHLNSTWTKVVTRWKHIGKPKLYFVGVDIMDAYGSIVLDKLMEIVKSNTKLTLGKQKSVILKKLTCVKIKKGQLYWSSVSHFLSLPFEWPYSCVLFDSGEDKEFSVKTILTTIRNAVQCQTIQRGMKRFLIRQGITQGGSPLSQALCDVYYSALDKTHLSKFRCDENDFLIRSVDDYLYITPDISRAQKFKEVMHKGFPDFGVFINPKKTKCNFGSNERHTMQFCGYSLNCNSLEVTPSFSCYNTVDIQHTIMFNNINNPGRFLQAKMDQLNAVKLNRFTLDLEYNSVMGVYCNVFEASILMACRLVTIVMKLFEEINSEFLISQIYRSASSVACIVCRLSGASDRTCIDFNGVLWIVYSAFHVVLKKKIGTFSAVVKRLIPLMYSVQAKVSVSSHDFLKYATDMKRLPQELKLLHRYTS